MEIAKMETCQPRLNSSGHACQDFLSDRKSMFCHIDNQPLPTEVICPKPNRADRVPYFMHNLNRDNGKPNGSSILPVRKVDCAPEVLDILLNKDEPRIDLDSSSQVDFFCGSPPARSNNPIVRDAEFGKQSRFLDFPVETTPCTKQAERTEREAPTSCSSPKVRIEGFACGSSESHCVVPAFA